MKTILFLLLTIPLFGQVAIVQYEKDGLTYQDAIMNDSLFVEGEIHNLRCVVCSYEIMTNGHHIKDIEEPIKATGFIHLSKDAEPIIYNILMQRVGKPYKPGRYIIKRGNIITNEIFIDTWGSFSAINGGI